MILCHHQWQLPAETVALAICTAFRLHFAVACEPLNDMPTTTMKSPTLKLHSRASTLIFGQDNSVTTSITFTTTQNIYSGEPKTNCFSRCCLPRCSPHPKRRCPCSGPTSVLLIARLSRNPRPEKLGRRTGRQQEGGEEKEQRKTGRTQKCSEVLVQQQGCLALHLQAWPLPKIVPSDCISLAAHSPSPSLLPSSRGYIPRLLFESKCLKLFKYLCIWSKLYH